MLTTVKANKIKPGDAPLPDGAIGGLRLMPGKVKGKGAWELRFTSPVTGKRRDMGLGTYPAVSIADARVKANEALSLVANQRDPIEERRRVRSAEAMGGGVPAFERVAREVFEDLRASWRNGKHAGQWISTMETYVFPTIGSRRVDELKPVDFASVLRPIWLTKPETATRVKQRCHAVMKRCWAREWVQGNPLDIVDHLLPSQPSARQRVQHQPSVPWRDMPAFMRDVVGATSAKSRCVLEFIILTGARSGEGRGMMWPEIDWGARVWTVPAARIKAKVTHRVPLSGRCMDILHHQREAVTGDGLVFPGAGGKAFSDMTLSKFLKDRQVPSDVPGRCATIHGFRSTFRDWASEHGYPRDLAERALAHAISNKVEAAYHRTDLLEQRRNMMEAWAHYLEKRNG